jgi:hypothetical protein
MTGPGILSITYACCQMMAGYFFAHRLKAGLIFGTVGGLQGLVLAFWSPDARGLVLSCTTYIVMNYMGLRSGRWDDAPWFRHPKETE